MNLNTPSRSVWPADPISAVVHPDPYGYYAGLVEGPPLVCDERLRLWIAAQAPVVDAALSDPRLRVRPSKEPVPAAIVGGCAGGVFYHLVRMNEGRAHTAPKLVLQRVLAAVGPNVIVQRTQAVLNSHRTPCTAADLSNWTFAVPVSVVASLLGFPDDELPQVADWMGDFVACLSPLSQATQISDAHTAADRLLERMKSLLSASVGDPQGIVARVAEEARTAGWTHADAIVANLVGLLSQTFDATAGLVGNSIVALASHPELRDEIGADSQRLSAFVEEVSRHDPSVQNTRRYVSDDMQIAGVTLHAGDPVLVVLAAANRDPQANPQPHAFQLDRPNRRVFSFGHARHACPGHALACAIASTALSEWGKVQESMRPFAHRYRPSVNARIPIFIDPKEIAA